jgi:hypothetical protein
MTQGAVAEYSIARLAASYTAPQTSRAVSMTRRSFAVDQHYFHFL